MGLYIYKHPKTGKVVEVIQRMTEPHVYSENGVKFERVFTPPHGATDTYIDPYSSKDFVEKTGKKRGTWGDMEDAARELSEKRTQKLGYDPVRKKYFEDYSKKRKGRKHPSQANDPIEVLL